MAMIALLLAALALAGCGTVQGWARGGTDTKSVGGASVRIPLGK